MLMSIKKYWFISLLAVGIVGSFTAYYVGSARETRSFKLVATEGDAKEAEGVRLYLNVTDPGMSNNGYYVESDGSRPASGRTFYEWFVREDTSFSIERLIREYPGFMRGKQRAQEEFYEDEHRLIHATLQGERDAPTMDQARWVVSELEKGSNESTRFEVVLPNGANYRYMQVMDVQAGEGGSVQIVTRNRNLARTGDGEEIHLYTVPLNGAGDVRDQVLIGADSGYQDAFAINGISVHPSRYLLLNVAQNDGYILRAYDLHTGAEVKLDAPELESMLKPNGTSGYFESEIDDDTLTAAYRSDTELKLLTYSLSQGRAVAATELPAQLVGLKDMQSVILQVNRGRIFIMGFGPDTETKDGMLKPKLVIIRADNGQVVYRGEVRSTGGELGRLSTMFGSLEVE